MTQTSSTSTSTDLSIIEVKPGLKFAISSLKQHLPDVETVLFFGKVYELDYTQLSNLLYSVHQSNLIQVLNSGDHSTDLQDYIVDVCNVAGVEHKTISYSPTVPHGEILPEVWDILQIVVAQSIKDVAAKLVNVIGMMPGKEGQMLFKSLVALNKKRPTIGDYKASIHHAPQKENLVILDDSGSMSRDTVSQILEDVVAMAYEANAHLVLVSNTARHWEPGNYDVPSVLDAGEFGGTQYETLAPVLSRDWGVVVTIADYDSSLSAKQYVADQATGSIDEVIDISLVPHPTFLAECVGQVAAKVTPVLIAARPFTKFASWPGMY